MVGKTAWRNRVSDAVRIHQVQALNTTFVMKSVGLEAFLFRVDGQAQNVKVSLGDPHTCTCQVFNGERGLCKHTCWYQ